jgi:hypothetical protein
VTDDDDILALAAILVDDFGDKLAERGSSVGTPVFVGEGATAATREIDSKDMGKVDEVFDEAEKLQDLTTETVKEDDERETGW